MIERLNRFGLWLALVLLATLPGEDHPHLDLSGCAVRDRAFETLFTRSGGGWTGGDGTYSVPLPDGRTIWMFGDTFLGTVHPDRSRPADSPLIRLSLVVQDRFELTTLFRQTPDGPTVLLTPGPVGWWYWPLDGTVEGNHLYLFLAAIRQESPGSWGFAYAGQNDIAVFSLPALTIERVVTVNTPFEYGVAILEEKNETYIYGLSAKNGVKFAYVARTHTVLETWEYFDGKSWSPDSESAAPILQGVSDQYSVIKWDGIYYLITQATDFGAEIWAYVSQTPTGPWSGPVLLYRTPESGGHLFTYNAVAHPQFVADEGLLISYNVNSFELEDIFDHADNYRPHFIRVPFRCLQHAARLVQ